ncbi:hypothetical protein GCM10027072_76320 [Streptomyces bullii]
MAGSGDPDALGVDLAPGRHDAVATQTHCGRSARRGSRGAQRPRGLCGLRQISQALPVLLDFLTGAGLIRLAADISWSDILVAAVVIAVRKIAAIGVTLGPRGCRRDPHHLPSALQQRFGS